MSPKPRVGLFVTCLVDVFRRRSALPRETAGRRRLHGRIPVAQTCCGQPAYNSGDRADARDLARQVIAAFEDFDYVVVPSGSCGGTIKRHYPHLFDGDPLGKPAPNV